MEVLFSEGNGSKVKVANEVPIKKHITVTHTLITFVSHLTKQVISYTLDT